MSGAAYGEFRCAVRSGGRCVLRMPVGQEAYRFQELDPIKGAGRELARAAWTAGVVGDRDVAPAGASVALPSHDTRSAKILVVGWYGRPSSEISLQGASDLVSINWAADGSGWFVSMNTIVGSRLIYAYPDRRTRPMGGRCP